MTLYDPISCQMLSRPVLPRLNAFLIVVTSQTVNIETRVIGGATYDGFVHSGNTLTVSCYYEEMFTDETRVNNSASDVLSLVLQTSTGDSVQLDQAQDIDKTTFDNTALDVNATGTNVTKTWSFSYAYPVTG